VIQAISRLNAIMGCPSSHFLKNFSSLLLTRKRPFCRLHLFSTQGGNNYYNRNHQPFKGLLMLEVQLSDRFNDNNNGKIHRLVEVKLEHIVDNLLKSKRDDDDAILPDIHQTIERVFITSAMRLKNNNVSQAAKLLGINRNTLSKKLKELNLLHDQTKS
jgi:DNA-binding protein Fis